MKRLLFNSVLLSLWAGLVFFSCGGNDKGSAGNTDTAGKNIAAGGETIPAGQTDTTKRKEDTALMYKTTAPPHSAPGQAKIDSIKNAKTKKKK